MIKFKSLEEGKLYVENYLEETEKEFTDLLSKDNKEFRLILLYSIRCFIPDRIMKKYDNDERAIFTAVFHNDFNYIIPTPNVPNVELDENEMNWFERLEAGGIQAAHVLVKNNRKVNLNSIKKIYYYAVNHGYNYDDPRLLQLLSVMARKFVPDRVKKEECFNEKRIFFKTFLPEYHALRYNKLDYLDILYCIDSDTLLEIYKKSQIKQSQSKWLSNRNGVLIDDMIYAALDEYMNVNKMPYEERLNSLLSSENTILTESPLLAIYSGHKKMIKILKRYNLKGATILSNNNGRWIYHHVIDMYMTHLDRENAINIFPYYYNIREAYKLPNVECLDAYKDFKDKQQDLILNKTEK